MPINVGAISSVTAILNIASGYAFGSVISNLAGFQIVKNALLQINTGAGPLLSEIITTDIMVAFRRGFRRDYDFFEYAWKRLAHNVSNDRYAA